MTERSNRCIEEYRTQTRRTAAPDFAAKCLDRLGLADRYLAIESAIGPVYVAWNPVGVSAVRQASDSEAFERWFRKRFARRALPATGEAPIVESVRRALAGESVPELAIDLRDCTPFEADVLRKAREIGRGHARPYAWLAREINRPRAVRAVGSALANNPVPLLIPCHRVVRSDYSSGEYVFGSDVKRKLLEREGLDLPAITDLVRHGYHYLGQPDDGCFCLPTCGNVIHDEHLVRFHSVDEAIAQGLEPCTTCRPMAA